MPDLSDRQLRGMMLLVDEFAADMKARLLNRNRAGHTGWSDPSKLDELLAHVLDAATRIPNADDRAEQAVDTANLAFFLWYHFRHGQAGPQEGDPREEKFDV